MPSAVDLERRAAAASADSFTRTFEESGKGWFWEVDRTGRLVYLSPSVAAAMGFAGGEYRDKRFTDLTAACWDEAGEGVGGQRTLSFYLSRNLPFTDLTVRSVRDEAVLWSLTGRPMLDDQGEVTGFRGIGADLSEKTKAEAELRRAARYDALTGLPNRATILRALEEALQVRSSGVCALLIVDLDRFKEVNDTHGHLVGDELLRQASDRINQIMGKRGTVGRLGGDEFEVVIPRGCSKEEIQELAEACIRYISIPYKVGDRKLNIGASIGIAFAERDQTDAESLFRKADLALYGAKEKRGTARQFEPEMEITAANRQALEHDLRGALAEGGLSMHFQPIVASGSEKLVGFEALVRWDHPEQGQIPPGIFVELAEESGLISQLGEWVLKAATQEAAKWPGKLFVAVNVSPSQFLDPDFTRVVLQALADAQFPAARLELEVTEAVFLSNSPRVDDTFKALKRIGVRLALDDFGTGYSSLAYLERAPFDKLKIDRTFVKGACLPGSKNLQILEAIVNLAHRLELETTAEGAETHQELELIRSLACTYIQGFIFGRPMNAADTLRLTEASAPVDAEGYTFSRAPRHRLIRRASLHLGGQSLPVVVRNVSAGGALIDAGRDLRPETMGKLELAGYNLLEVEIRWSHAKRAGIRFLGEFDIRGLLSAA
ncbi:MAG TPA: EAL domain-containing protein [Allosphingosinicella sp.]|nr:EAL domain-containing protein [Allosphingosinicella sp.]